MKKIILLLSVVTLAHTSCSKSEDIPVPDSSDVLLKKTITLSNGVPIASTYTYNGNKLDRITNVSGYYDKYTYTGNLITKIESFKPGNQHDNEGTDKTMIYDNNGKLISSLTCLNTINSTSASREDYTYNANGTVSVSQYVGDQTIQTHLVSAGILYFTDGEITKIERTFNGAVETSTKLYTYDNKYSPFKNIIGFDKITCHGFNAGGINHNVTSINVSSGSNNTTIAHTYNVNGFPVTETSTETGTIQFVYE